MGKHAVYFLRESCCVMETSQNKLIVMIIHVVPKKITDTKYTFIENNYTNCKQGHCHLSYKEGVSKAD